MTPLFADGPQKVEGILFPAVVGEPPFVDKNQVRWQIRHCREAPAPWHACNVPAPAGLHQVLDGILAKDPALRYPTPPEAARELRPFLTG